MSDKNKETTKELGTSFDWAQVISSVAPGLFGTINNFNYKGQKNEIELANVQLQTEQAKAQAELAKNNANQPKDDSKKWLIIGGAVLGVVVLILLIKKRKP